MSRSVVQRTHGNHWATRGIFDGYQEAVILESPETCQEKERQLEGMGPQHCVRSRAEVGRLLPLGWGLESKSIRDN